ncbi:MAG: hypothetical protein M0Q90_04185 [Bacteroidales bacterium]|nr:hypothetical protein [Bacteroidales bacterium]
MKRIFLLFVGLLISLSSQTQTRPETIISPFVDTTFTGFTEIYDLWESYLDELNYHSAKKSYILNEFPEELHKYWDQNEIDQYKFPDLFYSFKRASGNVFYPMEKEYLLGIIKREESLFELRAMFLAYPEEMWKRIPSYMITVPIKKQANGEFKLTNAFSHHKNMLETKRIGLIRFYYDRDYVFNTEKAIAMQSKIQTFKDGFGIEFNDSITYVLADNLTDAAILFGVQHYDTDFISGLSNREAMALSANNIIIAGGTGEDDLHEIIHLLLNFFQKEKTTYFEEGIATYFGGVLTKNYLFHIYRLKHYLNTNPWIDLSGSLVCYYYNDDGYLTFGYPLDGKYIESLKHYKDDEMQTPFIYTIHAAIVDIAYRQGGYEKVKELYLCEADNEEDFYNCIEEVLKIKRSDLNDYIREFINNHY